MSIREPDQRRSYDQVELRAVRDANSMVMQMSLATAEACAEDLRAEGWTVDILAVRE